MELLRKYSSRFLGISFWLYIILGSAFTSMFLLPSLVFVLWTRPENFLNYCKWLYLSQPSGQYLLWSSPLFAALLTMVMYSEDRKQKTSHPAPEDRSITTVEFAKFHSIPSETLVISTSFLRTLALSVVTMGMSSLGLILVWHFAFFIYTPITNPVNNHIYPSYLISFLLLSPFILYVSLSMSPLYKADKYGLTIREHLRRESIYWADLQHIVYKPVALINNQKIVTEKYEFITATNEYSLIGDDTEKQRVLVAFAQRQTGLPIEVKRQDWQDADLLRNELHVKRQSRRGIARLTHYWGNWLAIIFMLAFGVLPLIFGIPTIPHSITTMNATIDTYILPATKKDTVHLVLKDHPQIFEYSDIWSGRYFPDYPPIYKSGTTVRISIDNNGRIVAIQSLDETTQYVTLEYVDFVNYQRFQFGEIIFISLLGMIGSITSIWTFITQWKNETHQQEVEGSPFRLADSQTL